jgi:hypothetical protein
MMMMMMAAATTTTVVMEQSVYWLSYRLYDRKHASITGRAEILSPLNQ